MREELITMLLAASPLSELRGAIPLGYAVFHFSALKAFFLGVLGNLIPVLPLLIILYRGSEALGARVPTLRKFLDQLFAYTRRRHAHHFAKWSGRGTERRFFQEDFWVAFALFLFVAVPLPLTGAWSGTLAAFVFGIPISRAAVAIGLGVIAAGIIVILATTGVVALK